MEIATGSFIAPYPQKALGGELGLTAEDIARSLETRASEVRSKLKDRGFLERIEAQGLRATAIAAASKSNGLPFEEIVLDVHAAKFFVGKWDAPIGDSYLVFLIRLEARVETLVSEAQHDPILQNLMQATQLRMRQIEQGRQITKLELVQQDSAFTTVECAKLQKALDARLLVLNLPVEANGMVHRQLKENFLPLDAHSGDFNWKYIPQKNYQLALDYVNSWVPTPRQRETAWYLHEQKKKKPRTTR